MDFCLIFVPFGHYDEPEILRYPITSICPISADGEQPWLIDTSHAGHVCVRAGEPAILWRRAENEVTTLTIAPKSGGPSAALEWAQGTAHIDWPRAVPLEDGAQYRLKFKGVLIARELSVHIVPSQFSTEAHQIAWMATQGCSHQARLLLRRLR